MSPTPFIPCLADDTCKASPSLDFFHGAALPVLTSPWDVSTFTACASIYPFRDVADLSVAAASTKGSDSLFAGDRSKCVLAKNSPLSPKEWDKIREKFLADVALNRMVGPFLVAPFRTSGAMPKAVKSRSARVPRINGTHFRSGFVSFPVCLFTNPPPKRPSVLPEIGLFPLARHYPA